MMTAESLSELKLPPTADFHCHLRQDAMMNFVTPYVKKGGVDIIYVMPNTTPPITTVAQAVIYHAQLSRLAPDVTFLMTLFLHSGMNETSIAEAAHSRIIYGVKLYPAGVTTNSQAGVLDLKQCYPIFEAMQEYDLVLNLHGEMIDDASGDVTVLNAEQKFMPQLVQLHTDFPELRIVLEHASTRQALEAVRKCGPNIAASITAHHLWATMDDWDEKNDTHSFCKPVAKTLEDRIALIRAVVEGSPKFFFGSDSAPHPRHAKERSGSPAAGCFTSGWSTSLVIGALQGGLRQGWIKEHEVSVESIEGFLSNHGRSFYRVPRSEGSYSTKIKLEMTGKTIPEVISSDNGSIEVVPFRRGKEVHSLSWI